MSPRLESTKRGWLTRRRRDQPAPEEIPPEREGIVPLVAWTTAADIPGLLAGVYSSSALLDKVGTASRCLQLCSQQIASMPLRYRRSAPAPAGRDYSPPWIMTPDPGWYPNGITDAVFAAAWSIYAQGDAFLYVTTRGADGYPQTWTVLNPLAMAVNVERGARAYRYNQKPLDPADVLQITRNPGPALRGTGALQAYASNMFAAYTADDYAAGIVAGGGVPPAVIKSGRRLTEDQAKDVKAQWITNVPGQGAAPAVLPPDLDFEQLAFSPRDLMLLESREFDSKQIAAAFGVPAPLLNMALVGGLTYQNPAALFDLWWRSELFPAAHRIENALGRWLPRGSWVEFDASQVTKPDFQATVTTWLAMYNAGVVTEPEFRAAVLDLPPLDQGDQAPTIDEPAGAGPSAQTPVPEPAPVAPVPLEVVQ